MENLSCLIALIFPILYMIAYLSVHIQISKGILLFSKIIQVVFGFVF